jgi:hypothetical protein
VTKSSLALVKVDVFFGGMRRIDRNPQILEVCDAWGFFPLKFDYFKIDSASEN